MQTYYKETKMSAKQRKILAVSYLTVSGKYSPSVMTPRRLHI